MVYSLGGFALGKIQIEQPTKAQEISSRAVSTKDSDKNIVVGREGATMKFVLEGKFNGTLGEIQTFISNMFGMIDGNQKTTVVYVSDLHGSFNVKVGKFVPTWTHGSPGMIDYTLEFIQTGFGAP